jgi:hypothetical protein
MKLAMEVPGVDALSRAIKVLIETQNAQKQNSVFILTKQTTQYVTNR